MDRRSDRRKVCLNLPNLPPADKAASRLVLTRGLGGEDIVDRIREIIDARHRHDDDVAMTLTVLGDAEEFAAAVFAQIDRKKFSLDLQLS